MDTNNPLADALNTIAAIDPATIPKTYDIPPHLERIVQLAAYYAKNKQNVDRCLNDGDTWGLSEAFVGMRLDKAYLTLTPEDHAILGSVRPMEAEPYCPLKRWNVSSYEELDVLVAKARKSVKDEPIL